MQVMVTEVNQKWANLQAKIEGFKTVFARYDSDTETLEIGFPPEGDREFIDNVSSFDQAKSKLAHAAISAAKASERE